MVLLVNGRYIVNMRQLILNAAFVPISYGVQNELSHDSGTFKSHDLPPTAPKCVVPTKRTHPAISNGTLDYYSKLLSKSACDSSELFSGRDS